ncbi:formate--tetrahydrofolate ligase [Prosthecomicrobium hirschii]|uniref:Formate--tetrahydrofolate ligase n=1 Tax=Prosthecodimorpha hirschii TaxID=665126 RepID=A0A0P6WKP6_9HYPH|nr:formate--tetrahydrofolate ligase [Prosthecomicrobium hirschii]KPL55320.1 formate--tetrahydrofolate ligase [Prosthecomicrobium hirschii]MCW1839715.1 formate--tetrahydrofolate ligase [Prosthecomicrobium hirschii]TPQ49344.1 formate--tetrahydrofolate ligase [Prosthecomicrobium hirschii]
MKSDIEIARSVTPKPIVEIGAKLGIPYESLHPYGHHIAKVSNEFIAAQSERPDGKLILVTAINPTPAGEGKTTTTVGLGDGLTRIGKKAAIALREPSLGPCFGVKGGAAGGGWAQVIPMEAINLHFTGDFHAITSAHNLLAAMLDNHIYWGNTLDIDPRRVAWRRVMDMNDRALRSIVSSLGGVSNGFPREDGFDITVASEVMAVFCLATDLADLEARLARMVVAETRGKGSVTAGDLKASPSMTVLLKDAFQPNLVQTLEGTPAFVHGGPFANIAHGCNSVRATRTALKLADYVVTEAGFGADLGAEKFFDIKCRKAGLAPDAAVIVATVRALKMHGGVKKEDLGKENLAALEAGFANLARHVENVGKFGVPAVVGINKFVSDTDAELQLIVDLCRDKLGAKAIVCTHWGEGSKGSEELARAVVEIAEGPKATGFKPLYPSEMPLLAKVETIAKEIYRAGSVVADSKIKKRFKDLEAAGYGDLPICVAKTQSSFSADPEIKGAPTGHAIPIREVRLSAGAGFLVVICGDIMTMPGLPKIPSAEHIRLGADGQIEGLS